MITVFSLFFSSLFVFLPICFSLLFSVIIVFFLVVVLFCFLWAFLSLFLFFLRMFGCSAVVCVKCSLPVNGYDTLRFLSFFLLFSLVHVHLLLFKCLLLFIYRIVLFYYGECRCVFLFFVLSFFSLYFSPNVLGSSSLFLRVFRYISIVR